MLDVIVSRPKMFMEFSLKVSDIFPMSPGVSSNPTPLTLRKASCFLTDMARVSSCFMMDSWTFSRRAFEFSFSAVYKIIEL